MPIAAVLRDHLNEHLLRLGRTEGLVFGVDALTPFSIPTTLYRARRAWGWRQKVQPGQLTRLWVPDEKRTTLQPITLHECRHTYASLMIDAGVNAKALSTYMGHASIAITMDRYGHLMPGSEDQAAGLLTPIWTVPIAVREWCRWRRSARQSRASRTRIRPDSTGFSRIVFGSTKRNLAQPSQMRHLAFLCLASATRRWTACAARRWTGVAPTVGWRGARNHYPRCRCPSDC